MVWTSNIHSKPEPCCGVLKCTPVTLEYDPAGHRAHTENDVAPVIGSGKVRKAFSHAFIMIKLGAFILSSKLGGNKPETEQDETETARASNGKTG